MDIRAVVGIMKRVHDAEGWNLGTNSTRETRNYFLERAVGIVHHGHPTYNPTPDRQWQCKARSEGGLASDDVVVSMPGRIIYDCIPGCGADGYSFNERTTGEFMPDQFVFVPRVPKLADGPWVGHQPEPAKPSTPAFPPYPSNESEVDAAGVALFADFARKGEAPNPEMFRHAFRTAYDWIVGNEKTLADSVKKHRAEWCALLGIPVQ